MKFRLAIQRPKPKLIGLVEVDVDKNNHAYAYGNAPSIGKELERVKLESISKDGVMLSGMEPSGVDKYGVPKYTYQEWWLIQVKEETP